MKFEDIFKALANDELLIKEQRRPQVPDDNEEPNDNGNLVPPGNDAEPIEPVQPEQPEPEQPEPEQPAQLERHGAQRPQRRTAPNERDIEAHNEIIRTRITAIDRVKASWIQQAQTGNMNITEAAMEDAIMFFNMKKNNLRPLHTPPTNADIPQLVALKQRFPEFPADDLGRIRDIQNYSWEQITFFRERYFEGPEAAEEAIPEDNILLQIEGVSDLSRFLPQAYELWQNRRHKLYDANGVTVMKINSKEESISLGGLQNCLKDKYSREGDNYWCTTWTSSNNMYTGYRDWRSFYYVLNRNVPENHDYRIFAIGAVRPDHTSAPFTLTNMYNDSNLSKQTFDNIISRTGCAELRQIQNQIVWFKETKKEGIERIYDSYTWDGRRRDTDFAFLRPAAQFRYIETGRNIRSAKALLSLGEVTINDQTLDLQEEYVRRTTAVNLQERFVTIDPSEDVFAMIRALRKPNKKFLNTVLITQQGVPDGVNAIVAAILNQSLSKSWKDYSRHDIRLFQSKNTAGLFGIYNLENFEWEKPMVYSKQPRIGFYLNPEDKISYAFIKYVSNDDYFYWMFRRDDLLDKKKNSPNYLKGKFLEGQDGDSVIGRLRKI